LASFLLFARVYLLLYELIADIVWFIPWLRKSFFQFARESVMDAGALQKELKFQNVE